MGADLLFAADPNEPLALWTRAAAPPPSLADVRSLEFELSSRGDRVPGRLLLPPSGDGPFPAVLLQHGAGGSRNASYLDVAAGPWVRAGAAVASIDFPLHGERASAKLAARLRAERAAPPQERANDGLGLEFARQAVVDLRRTADALQQWPTIDRNRIAYAGFSLGTLLGAIFCALDPRPCAAALAVGGGGFGPPEVDPTRYLARFAPRPVLFVNATRDATFSRESSQALFDAAAEPKEIRWFEGTHTELPGAALKAMWVFLRRHLGMDDAS